MIQLLAARTAVIGSREYPRMDAVRGWIAAHARHAPEGDTIVSGAARGVDRVAASEARARGLLVEEFPANWQRYGRIAGFLRNERMINTVDFVIAFWDGQSRGTKHAMDYARTIGKPTIVFGPDGQSRGEWVGQAVS